MRKFLAVVLVGMLAASMLSTTAQAGKKKKKKKPVVQEESGSVALPAPFTDDTGCYAGLYRRVAIMTMGASPHKGTIGWEFDVDEGTWGKNFVLEVTGGSSPDLDIYFYGAFGTPEDVVGDPGGAGAPYSVSFNSRNTDGESGEVPPDTTKVIVCMMAGGSQATFDYIAGDGVKLPE